MVVLVQDPKANPGMRAVSMESVESVIRALEASSDDSWEEGLSGARNDLGALLVETGEIYKYFKKCADTTKDLRRRRVERCMRLQTAKSIRPLRIHRVASRCRTVAGETHAKYTELLTRNELIKEQIRDYCAEKAHDEIEDQDENDDLCTDASRMVHRLLIVNERPTLRYSPANCIKGPTKC